MEGKLRKSMLLQSPYIKIKAKITMPGYTNGIPNIKEEDRYIVAPSAKKIATYIRNQLFGSDLVTQTEGLDINWLMPTLGRALEEAIYDKESFIYIHKFDNKVYLECLKKCDIHNLVQKYDKIISCDIIQDFEYEDFELSLHRHIENKGDGTTVLSFKAFERQHKDKEWVEISLNRFNRISGNDYKPLYNLPYEPLINIDTGQEFFRDSEKIINQEMIILNTFAEEIEKTKTRIVTTQHFQSGDITSNWRPASNMYEVQTIEVNHLQDYFTLLPGDREHQMFEFLQGDIRSQQYIDSFKFCDYQVIQMANLSPATFGYEKDSYQNVASIDLNANLTEMTIEAIKKQLEPQINKLIENVVKLQQSQNMNENLIPVDLDWDYGSNERFDDMKKLNVLQTIQRTASVPYSIRAKIITPILNKLIDEPTNDEDVVKAYKEEERDINIDYEEF
jgi:hypothetical protein